MSVTKQFLNRDRRRLNERWTIVQWGFPAPSIQCAVCRVPMELHSRRFTNEQTGETNTVPVLSCPQCGDTAGNCNQAAASMHREQSAPRRFAAAANS
jgi:hypothetical protein